MPKAFTGRDRSYQSWRDMMDRCEKPHHQDFKWCGGRGVKVCDRWREFENFFADMGERPAGCSLGRVNDNGGYENSNCLWVGKRLVNEDRRRTYITWRGMVRRCCKPDDPSYRWYGGRGITICERWQTSFENFLADMGYRPADLTIERNNNDGNYEPSNCRWATRSEQQLNKRPRKTIRAEAA